MASGTSGFGKTASRENEPSANLLEKTSPTEWSATARVIFRALEMG
jgi:hypothetical protein